MANIETSKWKHSRTKKTVKTELNNLFKAQHPDKILNWEIMKFAIGRRRYYNTSSLEKNRTWKN